ncbi:perlucin-like protein isoform X2 [Argopecten irradians]|uniref:perlucin-like protein isoform X2 n=1 Tax=Argopecten irradians TaxID=31199 RepID=UPI0037192693
MVSNKMVGRVTSKTPEIPLISRSHKFFTRGTNMDVRVLLLILPVVYCACPSPWDIEFQNSCYMIVKDTKTWAEADRNCEYHHQGGHLVKIERAEEQNFLTNYIKPRQAQYSGEFWIDGTDNEIDRHFMWDYKFQPMTYKNWKPGEPNKHKGLPEHCVEYGESYNYQWNDNVCDNHFQSICEFEKRT